MKIEKVVLEFAKKNGYTGFYKEHNGCCCDIDNPFACFGDDLPTDCNLGIVVYCKDCKENRFCYNDINGFCVKEKNDGKENIY